MATPDTAVADPTPNKPPRPRRLIPLSLRLFVVMLVALGLIESLWIGIPAYRQRRAVIAIEKTIGAVGIRRAGPEWLQDFFGEDWESLFGQPCEVRLFSDDAVDDDFLAYLSDLPAVERLQIDGAQITDRGLACLACLTQLRDLDFRDTCGETQVTDAGLSEILRLSNLRFLNLSGTRVTGSGLGCLVALRKLEYLELNRSQLRGVSFAVLTSANPNLTIVVDDEEVMSPDGFTRPQDN